MVMAQSQQGDADPIEQGAQAPIHGRPKDACPYPPDSEKRASWLEDYDGAPRDRARDLLLASA